MNDSSVNVAGPTLGAGMVDIGTIGVLIASVAKAGETAEKYALGGLEGCWAILPSVAVGVTV